MLLVFTFGSVCSQQLSTNKKEAQPAIVAIFPSADTLPANLLRMYIQFSYPMKTSGNLERIQVQDDGGNEVEGAIFNNAYELWNTEQTLLTILFDPSRVKTGLRSHETRGRALQPGRRYHLVMDPLQDVEERSTTAITRSFYVREADFSAPDKAHWTIEKPKAGSRKPLIIHFPQMLDWLSLQQRLMLTDASQQPVEGEVVIRDAEKEWYFKPTEPWSDQPYTLFIHGRLEDPSGNNLNGLFDHEMGSLKNTREGVIETITLRFEK